MKKMIMIIFAVEIIAVFAGELIATILLIILTKIMIS